MANLFVAIDRTSKFAVVRLEEKANTKTAPAFLDALVEAVAYAIHTVLPPLGTFPSEIPCQAMDNGIQFADLPKNRNGPTARFRGHPFDRACGRHQIEHRLTKPNHPFRDICFANALSGKAWTNGQLLSDCKQSLASQRVERPLLGDCPQSPAGQRDRTIKEATTVRRCRYVSHDDLRRHLGDFMSAYNFAGRLKT